LPVGCVSPPAPRTRWKYIFSMLTTGRLIVRSFRESDYKDLHAYLSLPETYRFERGGPISLEKAKEFVRDWAKGANFWAATLKENHKLIGHVSFFPEGPEFLKTWEIGFIFNPAYQNRGYCSEASLAVMKYAFDEMGVHRIVAHCSPENIPSWKVLEKCGMKREGYLRKNFSAHNDETGNPIWLDSYSYGILDEDIQ
jgi:ribosomal-protein-alanine N-acetyltransferase